MPFSKEDNMVHGG